jgi:hypothetical protein
VLDVDEGWRALLVAFPSWNVPPETVRLWTALLRDICPMRLIAGALALAKESKYPPSLAEWRARALTCGGGGLVHGMSAAEAWDEMRRHRMRFSPTRHAEQPYQPKWSSEAVRRASEAVSWRDPDWTAEQIPTIRSQFHALLRGAARQAGVDRLGE